MTRFASWTAGNLFTPQNLNLINNVLKIINTNWKENTTVHGGKFNLKIRIEKKERHRSVLVTLLWDKRFHVKILKGKLTQYLYWSKQTDIEFVKMMSNFLHF